MPMVFSRGECWSRLPFLTPRDLPDPGMESISFPSPALAGIFFTTAPTRKPMFHMFCHIKVSEKALAPHSSTLAWKIPWMEEPGRLQSMGLQRVGHDWMTSLSRSGEGNGNPLPCSCLENPRDGGAWWATIFGVTQSQTRLTWLSSSRSSHIKVWDWERMGNEPTLEKEE